MAETKAKASTPEESPPDGAMPDPGRATDEVPAVREDLRAALRSLEQARHEFKAWAGSAPQAGAPPQAGAAPQPDPEPQARSEPRLERHDALRRAEAEAEAYLENAKRRVDALCRSMLSTIEEEAWALRREAEEAIRARWSDAEEEANAYLAGSLRQADRIVEERRARIAELSRSITHGAARITSRLDDADRVQAQFDRLVLALSQTAERIAHEHGPQPAALSRYPLR